jgi:hypothetical protein
MQAEKVLKKAGFSVKLIPVPRQFSSDCGISLRFDWSDYDKVKATLSASRVELHEFHQLLS